MPEILLQKLFLYTIIILSAVIHEYSHAWTADFLGDPTARYQGRLTLNPLRHLDPVGTVVVPLFLLLFAGIFIGWAKPVPFNPYNLRDQKWGILKVGLAGPTSNLFLALVFGTILRVGVLPWLATVFSLIVAVNIFLALFNLLPIPPLDGSKVFGRAFPGFIESLHSSGIGLILALVLAFLILPSIAQWLYFLITGMHFGF